MNDRILLIAVIFLGIGFLGSIGAIAALAATGNATPDILQNTATGTLTGLIGLLVPTKANPMNVYNGEHRAE